MGPVLAALIVVPFGQPSIAWFSSIAFLAIVILWRIGVWYKPQIAGEEVRGAEGASGRAGFAARHDRAGWCWSRCCSPSSSTSSSLSSYYIFYLIEKFGVSTQAAQLYLFIFLAANAVGAFFGGPLGDRFGRKYSSGFRSSARCRSRWRCPMPDCSASAVLTMFIGLIISSATSSIIVFAQELMPHRFGMISGVFFGVAFGIGGLGAAVLGRVADHIGIAFVYQICAFLPAIGLLAVFLPKMPKTRALRHRSRCAKRIGTFGVARRPGYNFINTLFSDCGEFAIFCADLHAREKNRRRLSTLKIRVKWRLRICGIVRCEFLVWGFVCLTGQEDEANA